MVVSDRQRRILEVLLQRRVATAGEIAEEVQISARSVHRDMREIKELLKEYELVLETKSGKGISIQGTEPHIERFRRMLAHFDTVAYASEDRRILLLCELLQAFEPIKLYSLAYEINTAIPTVSKDLDEAEPLLARHGLKLIRRRGYGVELAGPEAAKRRLIEALAAEYVEDADLFGTGAARSSAWPVTRRLLELIGQDRFHDVERVAWKLQEGWAARSSEAAYTRLLLKLSIAIARMRSGHGLERSGGTQPGGGRELGTARPPDSAAAANAGEREELAPLLEAFTGEWPAQEREAVRRLLRSAREEAESHNAPLLNESGMSAADTAGRLAQAMEAQLHIPFGRDDSLMDGLIRHMAPALARLRRGETIRNPLLPQIRKDYAALFEALKSAAADTVQGIDVPDEEIGHLAMHFGAAMERWNLNRKVRALIVCTSGIGFSKLLAARIAKEFPQIECVGPHSWYDASRISPDRYDIIISTVDLPLEPESYLKVSPLLKSGEAEKLSHFLRSGGSGGAPEAPLPAPESARFRPAAEEADSEEPGGWLRLKRVNDYASAAVQLLETFDIYELGPEHGGADLRGVIQAMLSRTPLRDRPADAGDITERLIAREKLGSQAIAGTRLALLHTRSERLALPVLQLFRLQRPLILDGERHAEVKQIVLMLAPLELDRSMLEVLGEISAMLLLPEFVRLLEVGDAGAVKRFVTRELEQFVQLKWRGSDHT